MNRSRQKTKRSLRLRLTFLYTLMVVAVFLLVGGLYLIIQGYRFNRYDGQLVQGGLVQFNSYPSGASIWLDGNIIDKKTQNKLTISAGTHKFSMWRDGYNDWSVERTVVPGEVLWLSYVRLVPKDLRVDKVAPLAGISSHATAFDNKTIAVIEDPSLPNLTLLKVDTDTPTKNNIVIPQASYTAAAEGESQTFTVKAWARDNNYVLVEHRHGEHAEWLSVNTVDPEQTKNVSQQLGVQPVEVQYSIDDANTLYMLSTTGEVRRIKADQRSLSAPLLQNVNNFNLYDSSTIAYATNPSETGVRSVGYLTIGAQSPRVVAEYSDAADVPLALRINKYYGSPYLAVAHGSQVQILTGDLTASDAKAPETFAKYANFNLTSPVKWLNFSPDNHRFVYAQSENGVVTYDLDMKKVYYLALSGQSASVDWVDQHHFTGVKDGTLTFYDFDGSNPRPLFGNAHGSTAVLLQNGRFMYGLQASEPAGVNLLRVKMTAN